MYHNVHIFLHGISEYPNPLAKCGIVASLLNLIDISLQIEIKA